MEKSQKPPALKCANCSSELQSYGWQELLIIPKGPFPANRSLPLEILVCPNCGRMEFLAHDETRRLLGSGNAKPEIRLCHVCKHEAIGSERCPYCGAIPKGDRTPML